MKQPRVLKCFIAISFVLGLLVPLWAGGQQPRYDHRTVTKPPARLKYKICTVSDIGFAKCITSNLLSRFIKSEITPAQAGLVRSLLDAFVRDYGIGTGDLFVKCGNQWRSIDASFVDANAQGAGSSSGAGASLSSAEQRAVVAACSGHASDVGVDLTGGGAGSGSGKTHSDYVNSILDQVDGKFSGCKDDPLKPVQNLTEGEQEYIRKLGVPLEKIPGTDIPNPVGRHWDANAHTEQEIVVKIIFNELIMGLGKWAREHNERQQAEQMEQERREEEARAQQEAEERAQQEADGRASKEEEEASQQCLEGTQCANPQIPTASYPGPDGTGSTCAQRVAQWSRFKNSCDRSGWREFRCENFLRTIAGCVDMAEIRPAPDGDFTCKGQATRAAELKMVADKECESRSGIALVGERGQSLCAKPNVGGAFRMPALDICTDPTARTTSDQCRQLRASEIRELTVPARERQNQQGTQTRPNP